jgi:DNA topoisomerase-1
MTTLVIVESPAKAKTISRFLGSGYLVEASFGHVRDLPSNASEVPEDVKKEKWGGLGVNVDQDFDPVYVVPDDKKKHVDRLKKALKGCEKLLIATDEDREGESIGWHLLELLKPKVPAKRIVFHEITPEAIKKAIASARSIDMNLVRAQESRRVIDRLYGYGLSELLWKKVQRGLSAGRVQSVAVRVCVQRERERALFVSSNYWDLSADFAGAERPLKAQLSRAALQDGGEPKRVAEGKDFDANTGLLTSKGVLHLEEAAAKALAKRLADPKSKSAVTKLEQSPATRRPSPPFTTSTFQQEANRKLGMTARRSMAVAQQLYEGVDIGNGERVGLITYMRTDSVTLADRALQEAEKLIKGMYGAEFHPGKPTRYQTKSKGAQEAHEAIRPTELTRLPNDLDRYLDRDQQRVYELIWKRAVASQMAEAKLLRTLAEVTVDSPAGDKAVFAARGQSILFPGFLRAYVEGSDDPEAELGEKETLLPPLKQGQTLQAKQVDPIGHDTKPPARYTEASLIKRLEEEGIGRPSTYASIIGTIQDRGYVFKIGNALAPTFTAYAVTQLLETHFGDLVDVQFTSKMESALDQVAEGEVDFRSLLAEFYRGDSRKPGLELQIKEQEPIIDFPKISLAKTPEGAEPIMVKVGRYGPYFQRGEGGQGNFASVPDNVAPADIDYATALALVDAKSEGPRSLGVDPATGGEVTVQNGRFGPYVQLTLPMAAAPEPKAGKKPSKAKKAAAPETRRASLPQGVAETEITLKEALALLQYPRDLGPHPDDGETVSVNLGRFGPYVKRGKDSRSLADTDDPATVDLARAMELLAAPPIRRRAASAAPAVAGKALGERPGDGKKIELKAGRFGPYVTDGTTNATIPKSDNADAITLERALELIAAREAAGPSKGRGRFAKKGAGAKAPAKSAGKAPAKKDGKATGKKPVEKPTSAAKPKAAAKAKSAAKPKAGPKKAKSPSAKAK